jgi:rhamnogalacturonyl hydrolase YesR/pectin methylesterase-like acyl-CoA thioesterase
VTRGVIALLLLVLGTAPWAASFRADVPDAIVAADGSGQFRTVQAAIDAAPQNATPARPWVVRVKAGVYRELVYVQREKHFVALVGEDPARTVITYDLHANLPGPDGKPIGTFRTPSVVIDADDFTAENLTFENSAGPVGQAVAVRVDGDRVVFRNCRFNGWQDTVLLNRGRQYFEDSVITGHVDFIFGGATAFFERCRLHVWRDGYVTAAATPREQPHGFVFSHARITGAPGASTFLGRPWRDYAQVTFVNSEMSANVRPAGWDNWKRPERERTARYQEFGSTGPGADARGRVPWAKTLTPDEASKLDVDAVLGGDDRWNPRAVATHASSVRVQDLPLPQPPGAATGDWKTTGRSDPSFPQPSLAPGVDYTVPTEADIAAVLARIRDHFVHATPFTVIDTATGQPLTDLSKPTKTAGIDLRSGEFNDWTYSMGVVHAGMLRATEVTGDAAYEQYTLRSFDFIADHLEYFKGQAAQFGPQPYGYRRALDMRDLDDCGAIAAALIKAYARKHDPRYRALIDASAEFISHKMTRLPDGTFARHRPQWPTVWSDDAYMSIPLLAQMGRLTGDGRYFDDAARQVIGFADHLMDASGLYDHAFFGAAGAADPKFHWGRGGAWAVMANAELLSVLPEDHPQRARVLEIFRRSVQGIVPLQSGTGFWHQLVDRNDTYLETSATAMFTFAIARGVTRGWLPPLYAPVAQAGWRAIEQRVRADGQIDGICVSTTAAYDMVYYANRPTSPSAMQGYGPVLLAGAEMIDLLRHTTIEKTLNTFHYAVKGGTR